MNTKDRAIYAPDGELLFLHTTLNHAKTEFIGTHDFPLQVGHLLFPEKYSAKRHKHTLTERKIRRTAEVLIILSGQVEYSIWDYDHHDTRIAHGIAGPKDVLLLGKVGHSFTSVTKAEMVEIKQGPYLKNLDKEYT